MEKETHLEPSSDQSAFAIDDPSDTSTKVDVPRLDAADELPAATAAELGKGVVTRWRQILIGSALAAAVLAAVFIIVYNSAR